MYLGYHEKREGNQWSVERPGAQIALCGNHRSVLMYISTLSSSEIYECGLHDCSIRFLCPLPCSCGLRTWCSEKKRTLPQTALIVVTVIWRKMQRSRRSPLPIPHRRAAERLPVRRVHHFQSLVKGLCFLLKAQHSQAADDARDAEMVVTEPSDPIVCLVVKITGFLHLQACQ